MAAIKEIRIAGFQSHRDSVFLLGSGLNVITGPSGAGKTSIIRSVKWVAFNEPQGETFVNEAVGEAVVTLVLTNGALITKRRRKGKTSYLLQENEEDEGSLFEKSEVPSEVKQLLQIEKQTFGDFEAALNFAFQLDAPFLLSETASVGAKVLGKLAGTESVDLAIKGVSKDTYGTRLERTNAEKDIERLSGAILAYSHIDDAKEAVETAQLLLEHIEKYSTRLERLKQYRITYRTYTAKVEQLDTKLESINTFLPTAVSLLAKVEPYQDRHAKLLAQRSRYGTLEAHVKQLNKYGEQFRQLGVAGQLIDLAAGEVERLERLKRQTGTYQRFDKLLKDSLAALKRVEDLPTTEELTELEREALRIYRLNKLKAESQNAENIHFNAVERLKRLDGLEEGYEALGGLEANLEKITLKKNLLIRYGNAYVELRGKAYQADRAAEDLGEAQNELNKAWEAAGGLCPLCEQTHQGGSCT